MKTISIIALMICCIQCTKESNLQQMPSVDSRSTYEISGKIVWEGDTTVGVSQVLVSLTGAESGSFVTAADGLYSFTVSNLGIYTITPTKSANLLNGVTGIGGDATIIQQYVAGSTSLTPTQLVAADANKSNTITTADATIVNQSFLGNPAAQNVLKPSWTFVDRDYMLPTAPPIPAYPKTIIINIVGSATQNDFIGIKRGDVNSSCNPNN